MGKGNLFVLYEMASGFALFELSGGDEVASKSSEMQAAVQDFGRFSKMVTLRSIVPFKTAEEALENINSISEGTFGTL
jgi:nucleolar protein 56